MSAIEWVYANSKHSGSVYHVLVTLAIAYGDKGACLSMKDIADRTKVSQATARRAIDTLTDDKTIAVIRNGGEQRKHGATNCYRFVGYDTPSTAMIPLASDDTPVTQAIPQNVIPLSPGDTPSQHDKPETSMGEYAGAAGEQMLLSVTSSVCLSDSNQTDYPQGIDTRNIPAQTQDDLNRDFEAASPQERERAILAFSKANRPAITHQNEPPGSGQPPLPPFVLEAYRVKWDTVPLDGDEQSKLRMIITKHGLEALAAQEAVTGKCDGDGNLLVSPAGYMLKTLNGLKSQGKPLPKQKFVARAHQRSNDIQQKDYPDDMQFEPPPPKADMKGVAVW